MMRLDKVVLGILLRDDPILLPFLSQNRHQVISLVLQNQTFKCLRTFVNLILGRHSPAVILYD
jgi:hypothetical protein